jgi:glucosylceramidase
MQQVAFENADGQKVLVVTNSGPEKTVTLKQAGKSADVTLSPESLTTLLWA